MAEEAKCWADELSQKVKDKYPKFDDYDILTAENKALDYVRDMKRYSKFTIEFDKDGIHRNGKYDKICTGVFQIALWGYAREIDSENIN